MQGTPRVTHRGEWYLVRAPRGTHLHTQQSEVTCSTHTTRILVATPNTLHELIQQIDTCPIRVSTINKWLPRGNYIHEQCTAWQSLHTKGRTIVHNKKTRVTHWDIVRMTCHVSMCYMYNNNYMVDHAWHATWPAHRYGYRYAHGSHVLHIVQSDISFVRHVAHIFIHNAVRTRVAHIRKKHTCQHQIQCMNSYNKSKRVP